MEIEGTFYHDSALALSPGFASMTRKVVRCGAGGSTTIDTFSSMMATRSGVIFNGVVAVARYLMCRTHKTPYSGTALR